MFPSTTRSDVRRSTSDVVDAAGSAVTRLGRSAEDSARHLGEAASREARQVSESARDWWAHNRDGARDAMRQARQDAVAFGHSTQDYVRERPVKSLLIVVALGAVIGGLVMMASRRER